MNPGLYESRKKYLFGLIKRISNIAGGDDEAWLIEYFNEVLSKYSCERIEIAIAKYKKWIEQLENVQ
jgi:hypothetical protein